MHSNKERVRVLIHLDEQTKQNLQGMRAERIRRGINRKELAERTGINYASIADYETGRYAPALERYLILAEFFGWNIQDSPNYKFAKNTAAKLQQELKKRKNLYGLTTNELSIATNFSADTIENALYTPNECTMNGVAAILHVIDEEERRSKFVQEITRSKSKTRKEI